MQLGLSLTGGPGAPAAFQGPRASYVALSAITTIGLTLLTSIWIYSDGVSAVIALMGLLSIYLASSELLVLFTVFSSASVIIDIIRLSVSTHHLTRGRGWLLFFAILEMLCKVAGAVLAWSLHRSSTQGEVPYQPVSSSAGAHHQGGAGGGSGAAGGYGQMPSADPFAGYHRHSRTRCTRRCPPRTNLSPLASPHPWHTYESATTSKLHPSRWTILVPDAAPQFLVQQVCD
ncbi:hypothetical protein CHLRE_17g734596v5 [Chlamydomonas reinhardtii]|uniref:Uncharacterized protein n=1 Tax=Chlamydomonas reinhardtii TaxID=3055 RepID=A8IW52_CHLRE|nr:uncharacterized protein CHLRE_17g734596v5 [Chlamydomonas reinhardtii]PNW70806.1 hypothetical protein CHLRE_17g734596v5 [Chlamydomonas reinhardtii]|eukprot:XP_001692939.1 predicted protein [Chlamydomonas reinhardtii]